jgi:CPA1 family monovalent cation:H+ antiporter
MDTLLTTTVGLLVVAIVVALVAHRLRLPYTVGLVVTGMALALSPIQTSAALTHDVIFDVILPPLLFEAAINIHWHELRRDALPILTLALPGTVIAAAVVAVGMVYALAWPIKPALLFGALIAATDPVAVIAMFKDNSVRGRLRLLVESESLLNDGVAAVLFSLVLAWPQASVETAVTLTQIAQSLLLVVGGSVLVGTVCASAAIALAGRTADYLIESTLTTVVAYGSFLLAEHSHCSGVLATVTAGLLMGNLGILAVGEGKSISKRGREFTLALWDFAAFVANSLVFLLIGLTVAGISFDQFGFRALAIVIALVLLGRALTVYPISVGFAWSKWRIGLGFQHVLWWGGLRGALGLALALSLDPTLQMRDQILVATFGVVVFSVVLQGLTMPLLLRAIGITRRRV